MSDIASMQAELENYRRRDAEIAVNNALAGAIQQAGVTLRPGVEAQAVALLRGEVQTATLGGQSVLCGPGLKPLDQHVKDRLNSPEFGHFRPDQAPAAPVNPLAPRPVSPIGQQAAALNAFLGNPTPALEPVPAGQSAGHALLAAAQQRATTDPRTDMSRPMGLTRRGS